MPDATYAQINTDNVIQMGRYALGADDYTTAIKYFSAVIESKPHLHEPYYYRAYAKFSLEDFVGAEGDCDKAIKINPYIYEVRLLRGLCRIHNGNYRGAIDDYTIAIDKMPENQDALYNRALCRLEIKEYESALQDLDLLLRKDKKQARLYMVKAQIELERGDTLQGIKWIDTVLSIDKRKPEAWAFKGQYALNKGQYQLADSCMTEAITHGKSQYQYHLIRALARNGCNRFGDALDDYDETIRLVPNHFVAHYNRGLLRALLGDNNRAIEDFDFVLSIEPDNTLALYNRALLYESTGQYRSAIRDFSALIKMYPNFLYGYQARANCKRKIGDIRGAQNDETVIARANLDLFFKPHKRKPIKKVRRRSEHEFDQYEQLIAENTDTTHSYVKELVNRVQDKRVEQTPIAPFALVVQNREQSPAQGYRTNRQGNVSRQYLSVGYMQEVDKYNLTTPLTLRLTLSTEILPIEDSGEIEHTLFADTTTFDTLKTYHLSIARSAFFRTCHNLNSALSHATTAIESTTDATLALLHRSSIYLMMLNAEAETNTEQHNSQLIISALSDINRALLLSPQNAILYYNKGCILMRAHRNSEAIQAFNQALSNDHQMAEAYYNLAILLLNTGDIENAISHFSKAGELGIEKAYALIKAAKQKK